jgi:hypothetical protein
MQLTLEERPYAGKTFRPLPEIHLDPSSGSLIVATPWGPRTAARKAIDRMLEFLALAREDREATSPFERLSCLSGPANNLRIGALLANDIIYREDNAQEYRAGVELFAMNIEDNEVVWVQAGSPQILLNRRGRGLLPLGSLVDLSFDMSDDPKEILPPLPSQLLGLDSSLNLTLNSFRARPGDRVVLLSHSQLPQSLFNMKDDELSLETLSRQLARIHPDLAFWLGIVKLGDTDATEIS